MADKAAAANSGLDTDAAEQYAVRDPEKFAINVARMIEQAGHAAAAWAGPRERGEVQDSMAEPVADMVKTFSKVTEYWLSDPSRALEAQTKLFSGYMNIWANSIAKLSNERPVEDVVQPDRGDKRFLDPEWGKNAFFDFLKQAYIVTSRWAGDLVTEADGTFAAISKLDILSVAREPYFVPETTPLDEQMRQFLQQRRDIRRLRKNRG